MTAHCHESVICCDEFEQLTLQIPTQIAEEDVLFVQREFGTRLTTRVELRSNERICVLNPNQYVGVLSLPSGRKLEIHSKVRAQNILYMLSFAEGLPWPFLDQQEHFSRLDELLEVMAKLFASRVAGLLAEGLHRSYAQHEENLRHVRGRIQFVDDLRLNCVRRDRTFCEFSELTWDIAENQLLRSTLSYLSGLDFARCLRLEISHLEQQMEEVALNRGRAFNEYQIHYHRMNEHYRPLHAMCRFFLEGASISEHHGTWVSNCFLVDMNELFEKYVSALLISECPFNFGVNVQKRIPFICEPRLSVQPDLLVTNARMVLLPLDCKYKKGSQAINEADLYQLLSYCVVTQCKVGILIFPEEPQFANAELPVAHSNIRLILKGLKLDAPILEFILLSREFARMVFRTAAACAEFRADHVSTIAPVERVI